MGNLDFNKLKERFIETYDNEDTQRTVKYILFNDTTIAHENALGKDLSHFNKQEIINLLGEFGSKSLKTVDSKRSYIASYIDFALDQDHLKTGFNYAKNIDIDILKSQVDQDALENKYLFEWLND